MNTQPHQKRKARPIAVHAWDFPKIDLNTAISIKALAEGTAIAAQQKAALDWIIRHASDFYGLSFRPGGLEGDRETCLAEGRRFVGNAVTYVLNMKSTQLDELKEVYENGRRNPESESTDE